MREEFERSRSAVRFGTKKNVGFPALSVIFDSAVRRDSCTRHGRGGGKPRIQIELSRC